MMNSYKAQHLYYVAFSIFLISTEFSSASAYSLFFSDSAIDFFSIACKVLCAALLIAKCFLQRYSRNTVLAILLILFLAALQSVGPSKGGMFTTILLFVLASENISIQRLAKIELIVQLLFLIFSIFGQYIGIFPESDVVSRLGSDYRNNLGYLHPNNAGLALLSIVISYCIICYSAFEWRTVVLAIVCFFISFFVVESRTSSALILLAIVFYVFQLVCPFRIRHIVLRLVILILGVLVCFWYLLVINFDQGVGWMSDLDSFLSNRVMLSNFYWNEIGAAPLGSDVAAFSGTIAGYVGFVCDSGYTRIMIAYGLLPGLVFLCLYFGALLHGTKNKEFDAAIYLLLIMAFSGFVESYFLNFAFNYGYVYFAYLLFAKHGFRVLRKYHFMK